MIFEREKIHTWQVVANVFVLGPKIPKFRILRWLLTWHRASENFDCYLKRGNANFVYKHFLKPAQGEMSSFSL